MLSFRQLCNLCVLLAAVVTAAADPSLRRKRHLISVDLDDVMTEMMRELKGKDTSDDYESGDETMGAKKKASKDKKGTKRAGGDSVKGEGKNRDSFMSMSMTFGPTVLPVAPVAPPVVAPSDAPVAVPSDAPVVALTDAPVVAPTVAPTGAPVVAPTDVPVVAPSSAPVAPPCDRETFLFDTLSAVTAPELLQDATTPQGMAYGWLLNTDTETDVCTYGNLEQRYAMATLYYSTDGSAWLASTGWLSSASECSWEFATCDGEDLLKSLELKENELSGPITTEFSVLSTLETIQFYNNEISGPLPSLAGFSDLVKFDVEENQFTGLAFGDLSSLSNLESYLISANLLTGFIPNEIGTLTSLKELWMIGNLISGPIPTTIGEATSLESIFVAENRIGGTLPLSMGNLSSLTFLYAYNNELVGQVPQAIFDAVVFEELQLYGNNLQGPLPEFDTSALTVFWIENNEFTGTLPQSLALASSLRNFVVGGNQFIGEIPSMGSPSLTFFDTRFNQLSGSIPSSLFSSPDALEAVYLQGNLLTGTVPDFSSASALVDMYLSGNSLVSPLPEVASGSLPALEELLLDSNNFTGTMPLSICTLRNLSLEDLWSDCAPPAKIECSVPDCCTRCFPVADDN